MPTKSMRAGNRLLSLVKRRWVQAGLLGAAALTSFLSFGTATPPSIPAITLASEPLYAKGTRDKPTLTLALSVEFPTVGAQYMGNATSANNWEDTSYSAGTEYIGYFDADSCYDYVNDGSATRRRFDRRGAATSRACGGTSFSGNFLNWATTSAIDLLRLGLTGGDRWLDDSSITVLQRAVLPPMSQFYNNSNFPAKSLTHAQAVGALPTGLLGSHPGNVWIANCGDRFHIGTTKDGSCTSPGNNANLGGTATAVGPVTIVNTALGTGFNVCAGENGFCSFSGVKEVAYGAQSGSTYHYVVAPASNGIACNNATWGDPYSGVVKNCYVRDYSGSWSPASISTTIYTSDNFFYARVKVCESDGSGVLTDPRADRCLRYPNGKYKPAGNLQKYSDRVRVAAFGYLMDNTQSRYGGVLRAPMKYVGPRTYDSSGLLETGANAKVEWDVDSGVFVANPEAATEGKSGVINYLNQFGRTGSVAGTYKTYDPVGELYYESLRYLQGLPPTPQATNGMTAAMQDGFPVYSSWTDPHAGGSPSHNYSCQRNNIVLIGDVNTHNDKSIPGNTTRLDDYEFARTANTASNEPDFTFWTKVVGGFESNKPAGGVAYLDGTGASRTTSNPNTPDASLWGIENLDIGATKASYYIAGMAYWANTHDIRGTDWTANTAAQRPGMRVTTYVMDVNEYGAQSNASTRHRNQFFLAAKYGGFKDRSGKGNPFQDAAGAADNSNWQKDTAPGEARTYYWANESSPRDVLNGLDQIFATIAAEGDSIAGGAISTQRLTSAGGYIYQAQFDPASWSGDLVAYTVSMSGTEAVVGDKSTALWSAARQLDARDLSTNPRKIYVGKETPGAAGTATEFTWSAIGSGSALQTALSKATPTAAADSLGASRVDFIKGDRAKEGSDFRRRGSRLGDIVNSGVAFSGEPTRSVSSSDFRTFYDTYKNRTKAIFVGANDGMLHAINAATGDELFGYIPSWVAPRLSALASLTYASSGHQSYVDATPTVAEALVGSNVKTVLVSGTGAGGQGVFALDVTDPSSFDSSKVMWEFTDRDDADMGNVVGKPRILKFRTSAAGATSPTYKWYAVVASGVDNYVDDGRFSSTGKPAIFLLDLNKSATDAWTEGTNYYKLSLPTDATLAATKPTGAVNFQITLGVNGEVAQLYAPDLHGRLWKLNFANAAAASSANWTVGNLSAFKDGSTPLPMFIAKDSGGTAQPISMAPSVLYAGSGGSIVLFGTGKYMESSDNTVSSTTQTQSVYALYDNGSSTLDSSSSPTAAISGRARLSSGTVSSGTVTVPAFLWGRAMSDTDTTQKSGWVFDYPTSGERQISDFANFGTTIVIGSVVPPNAGGGDACGSGSGNLYVVNVFTGAANYTASTVGMLGEPYVIQFGSATTTLKDTTRKNVTSREGRILVQGSSKVSSISSTAPGGKPLAPLPTGELSWRLIPNYHELRAN